MQQPLVGAGPIKEAFPKMMAGGQFRELFEPHAKSNDTFAAVVVGIDNFERTLENLGENITSGVLLNVAKTIDALSETTPMTWGRLDEARFACVCPDIDEPSAVRLAEALQKRLALEDEHTISVGLAVYPFWPFEKASILANAEKALVHAAFFGPDSVTPFDAVSLNISADKLYQYGDIDGTIEELKKALMVDHENVNVHNSLGVCYGVQGELDLAIDAFETATRLDPQDVMAVYNLGLAHLRKGDRERALRLFIEAHDLDGDNPDVTYQIGACYQETGQTDAALEYLEKAAQGAPKGAHVFCALGQCYMDKKMFGEAAKTYEQAVKRSPKDAKSLSALGHLYGILGENLEIAIVLARESTTIDPDNGLYRLRLGRLYLQSSDHDKALEQLNMAAEFGEECAEFIRQAQNSPGTS